VIAIEESAMLRPQDTSTRERKCLNGLWQFALDEAGECQSGRWFAQPLVGAREMAVPASFNDIAADAAVRDYFGDIWYQTNVWVPRGRPRSAASLARRPLTVQDRCVFRSRALDKHPE
jgi:beta-galactosidase/beta-glucuronidase